MFEPRQASLRQRLCQYSPLVICTLSEHLTDSYSPYPSNKRECNHVDNVAMVTLY